MGIRRDRIDALEQEIEAADLDADTRQVVDEELEAARERQDDLRKQIDRLRTQLEDIAGEHRPGSRTTSARPFPVPWN